MAGHLGATDLNLMIDKYISPPLPLSSVNCLGTTLLVKVSNRLLSVCPTLTLERVVIKRRRSTRRIVSSEANEKNERYGIARNSTRGHHVWMVEERCNCIQSIDSHKASESSKRGAQH